MICILKTFQICVEIATLVLFLPIYNSSNLLQMVLIVFWSKEQLNFLMGSMTPVHCLKTLDDDIILCMLEQKLEPIKSNSYWRHWFDLEIIWMLLPYQGLHNRFKSRGTNFSNLYKSVISFQNDWHRLSNTQKSRGAIAPIVPY